MIIAGILRTNCVVETVEVAEGDKAGDRASLSRMDGGRKR
jgi:hypothetical protein